MLNPTADRIIVKRQAPAEEYGGILIPDAARELSPLAMVVAVGPGRRGEDGRRIPLDVWVGDTVYFNPAAGTELEVDGEKVLMLRETAVVAVIG